MTPPSEGARTEDIVAAVRRVVEGESSALALMEGGSAAFGRVDEWSDVDLYVIVEDGSAPTHVQAIADALAAEFGIAAHHAEERRRPGVLQHVFQLVGARPSLLVDLCLMDRGHLPRTRSRVRHGRPIVHFDKDGVTAFDEPDADEWRERIRDRVRHLAETFHMYQSFVRKHVARGNAGEAVAYFNAYTLRPLSELLRIRHDPYRHDYGVRYVREDLPAPDAERLSSLYFVRDLADLVGQHRDAVQWFDDTLAEIDVDALPL